MPNSRDHCDGCKFGKVAPTNSELVVRIENSLVADTFFAEGNPSRQRRNREFKQSARNLGVETERIEAAQMCARRMLAGACTSPASLMSIMEEK
jgi:hypothetical protein